MTTVAETLVAHLVEAGVETIFGLPGGENVQVMEAIRRAGLRFVLVRNESSAVFMADATARLTGKPGVCLTTLGPGATNAVAGIAHAYLERAPLLIITAETPEHLLSYHTHQVIDLAAVFAPITKGTFQLTADNASATVSRALALTTEGRPGPVHLRVSNEEAGLPITQVAAAQAPKAQDHEVPLTAELAKARAVLAQAQRPVIIAGVGLEPDQPYAYLQQLAEAAAAPVIVTPKAKGALADDHPLAGGVIGLTRTDPAYQLIDEADAIIAVGFDVVELVKPWQETKPLIWLANWANHDPQIPATAELVGPLTALLPQLIDSEFATSADWGTARVAAFRQQLAERVLPEPAAGRMRPQSVLAALRQVAARDLLVATDVGSHKILAALEWPAYAPNRYLLSNGLSCMGYAVPAAIAASLTLGGAMTVALVGDAGFSMIQGELAMLQETGAPVLIIVFNDAALDLIRSAQTRVAYPPFGTEFCNPDLQQIAAAYGIDHYQVRNEAECATSIAAALAARRPCLIDAQIDPISYPTTPTQHFPQQSFSRKQ